MIPTYIQKYLKEHAISMDKVESLGLKFSENTISIPIKSQYGDVLFWKHRHFKGDAKYTYDKGSSLHLFGMRDIEQGSLVFIVEGEFDAMSLWCKGIHAVSGTGGSSSWNDGWNEYFKGLNVCILYDNDEPGAKGAYRVWDSLNQSGINASVMVTPREDKDIATLLARDGGYSDLTELDCLKSDILSSDMSSKTKLKKEHERLCRILVDSKSNLKYKEAYTTIRVFHEKLLEELKYLKKKKTVYNPGENGEKLETLKKIPITDFIRFHNGVASCVFHTDSNPSMHYNNERSRYPNTVKCYSCGTFGSVVDVIMAKEGVEIKGAIELLRKHAGIYEI